MFVCLPCVKVRVLTANRRCIDRVNGIQTFRFVCGHTFDVKIDVAVRTKIHLI